LNGDAAAGDRFGSSLGIARNRAGTGFDLWIGAPLDDVGTLTDAGSVAHYSITNSGGNLAFNLVETITQNSPGVPGGSETNDQFGAALSATSRGVLIGDQLEDVGKATNAGSITLLTSADDDAGFDQAFSWSQATSAVPGSAESGDHFGAAVGLFGEHLAPGVPDEDVGASSNAGMVQLFSWSSTTPVPTGEVKQYTPGCRGRSRAVIGRNISCFDNSIQVVAGVPGEDTTVSGWPERMLEPSRSSHHPPMTPVPDRWIRPICFQVRRNRVIALAARWPSDGTAMTMMMPAIAHSSVCLEKMVMPASCNPHRSAAAPIRRTSSSRKASTPRSVTPAVT